MGKEFYDASPEAEAVFNDADGMISGLKDCIFDGPLEKLTSTSFCQPAIFTFSYAALRAFQAHSKYQNISVEFSCGLSLGEYCALAASNAFSFIDALKLVERRSSLMEEAAQRKKGAMAAVIGFDKDELLKICEKTQVQVANFNSPEQIVITGEAEKVAKASQMIKEQGAKRVIPLDVSGAFHSRLMEPAVAPFEDYLKSVSINKPDFPILSNVDAFPESDPQKIRQNLAKQITSPVQWVDSINCMVKAGVTHFIEIGPGTVLKGLIRKINRELSVYNIQKPADIEILPL